MWLYFDIILNYLNNGSVCQNVVVDCDWLWNVMEKKTHDFYMVTKIYLFLVITYYIIM
jgi:hypothetical protein